MAEERMLNDEILLGLIKANSGGGGGGTTDYEDLVNKPQIGGVTLSGNKSLSDLGAQEKLTAGMYININSGTISVKRDVSEDVDEVLTLTHDTSGGTNKVNAVLTVGGETIDSETITTSGGTFHDLVQISFNGQAVRFKFKYLVASKTQSAGYENYIYNEYTDTFVETIGEESKLIIKSELDTALSGKQDTLTFDNAPTENSNNPVKSGGVFTALAGKVNTENGKGLSTNDYSDTEKAQVATNANDISSLKSGLTTLDNEVNCDATTYDFADVITIEDAVPANLADCTVKIEPVQSGSGDPSPENVRPITGHIEASVEVTDGDETTETYTIALGDTIYGGTVDFDSGVMTVTMAQIASYDGETIGEPWISDRDVYTAGTTPTTGAQVVYTLATPTTIQLTPQQIQLLKGTNTITASTGQISVTVNGVSGSIGAVQEQVNDIAEDVTEKQDKNVYMSDWRKTFTVKCAINTLIMLGGSGTRSYLYLYNNYINLVTPITDSSETVTAVKNEDGTTTFTWEHDMHMSVMPLDAVIV